MSRFNIPLDPYPYVLIVSFNEKDAALIAYLQEYDLLKDETEWLKMDGRARHAGKAFINSDKGLALMRFNFPLSSSHPDALGTVGHEAFHVAHMVLDAVGVNLSFDSDEAYAYLIGHIIKEIYNHRHK